MEEHSFDLFEGTPYEESSVIITNSENFKDTHCLTDYQVARLGGVTALRHSGYVVSSSKFLDLWYKRVLKVCHSPEDLFSAIKAIGFEDVNEFFKHPNFH